MPSKLAAGWSNMPLAATQPTIAPRHCADTNEHIARGSISRRRQKATDTTGLKCAPETLPNTVIST